MNIEKEVKNILIKKLTDARDKFFEYENTTAGNKINSMIILLEDEADIKNVIYRTEDYLYKDGIAGNKYEYLVFELKGKSRTKGYTKEVSANIENVFRSRVIGSIDTDYSKYIKIQLEDIN